MRVDPSSPRDASSGDVPPPPSSAGADATETSGVVPLPPSSIDDDAAETSGAAATNTNVPSPTTSDDSDIRRTLDHVLTVQVA